MNKEEAGLHKLFGRRPVVQLITWCCRFLLAFIFFYAGVTKIGDPRAFADTVGSYGLLPDDLVYPVAMVVPPLETLVAIGLLLARRTAVWASLVFLILFIMVISYGLWLGLDIDCGCFNIGSLEHKVFSGLKAALYRDLLLLLPLFFLLWQSLQRKFNNNKDM